MIFLGTPIEVVTKTPYGDITWGKHICEAAPLNYRGHMRFLQGASLVELFLPLLLLKGTPNEIWRVPFELHDVILAEVHEAPDGLTQEQIHLELVKSVFAPVRTS